MRSATLALTIAAAYQVNAISLRSIAAAASSVAKNLMGYYNPANVGVLPAPYYWWEGGAMWGGMVNYWHITGDATYNDAVSTALLSQVTNSNSYQGPQCDGNDDQGWWALAAMTAAEYNFPSPAGAPSWLSLADNVFTSIAQRWGADGQCNGGLSWKIAPGTDGFHYKNSVSNGVFFQLAARLARHTSDPKYADWAGRVFDWLQGVQLIDGNYNVFDGTDSTKGCIDVDHDQWSYNVGLYLYGSAILQDHTGDAKWATRTAGLLAATNTFFQDSVMIEPQCERDGSCNTDQLSFKAYLSRWLAATSVVLPSTQGCIAPLLQASASGAAASCSGGPDGQTCGSTWYTGRWDGSTGVGQQLAALEIMDGLLASKAAPPGRRRVRRFMA